MNKKKIVILGSAYPLRGGLASYNERLCRAFSEKDYNARIETFKLQYPAFLFPGKTQYSKDKPPENINISVSVNSINPFNWIKIGNKIKKEKPDILIIKYWLPFMGPCFGTIARKVKKNKYTKVISILDNIIPHEKRPTDKIFTKYFIKPVDGFIAMSQSVLSDLSTFFDTSKPKIYSPHPLYDNYGKSISKAEARQKLNIDRNVKLLLFFGLIRDYKGLDILLNALADNILADMNIKLLVAGEFYSDANKYYKIIDNKKLNDKVIITDNFVPDSEVSNYFCAADLVVQPYKTATQSGVTQIAYHYEIPMIVTSVGGLPELVLDGTTGYVVNPDPASVAKAIHKYFIENKEEEFKKNIAIEKKKYSWEKMIESIESLLNQILKNDNKK